AETVGFEHPARDAGHDDRPGNGAVGERRIETFQWKRGARRPVFCVKLRCGKHTFDLARPLVMGILNVTPDSFYDGGQHFSVAQALERGRQMAADGADIIDVGGESTRPGASEVPEGEDVRRGVPLVET